MLAPKAQEHKIWPEKVFSTNNFPPPHLSSQNDQRDVGIILSHRCWVDPPPPARQVGRPRPEPPRPVTAAIHPTTNSRLLAVVSGCSTMQRRSVQRNTSALHRGVPFGPSGPFNKHAALLTIRCGISRCSILSLAKFAENACSPRKSRLIAILGVFRLENLPRPGD